VVTDEDGKPVCEVAGVGWGDDAMIGVTQEGSPNGRASILGGRSSAATGAAVVLRYWSRRLLDCEEEVVICPARHSYGCPFTRRRS
jgi:hypothetical protein